MGEPRAGFGFDLAFQEQIDFLKRKLNLPTERWDDIEKSAHDRAFIVAGAHKADLLADLHSEVIKNAEGQTLASFRQNFKAIVKQHGWTGWTGEGTKAGEAWRTKVIYDTNLRTSYAAGRWRQLNDPDLLAHRPFWRYVHQDGQLHPRPHHLAWNGLTLRHDHPFWKTHFAPNGWGCKCRITAVTAPQASDLTEPPAGWDQRDSKGNLPGIDKGWDYAPGASTDVSLRKMVQDKLISYPPAITGALSRDLNRYINAHDVPADYVRRVLSDRSLAEPLWLGFVENYPQVNAVVSTETQGFLVLLPDGTPRHIERRHSHDGNGQRPPLAEDFNRVWWVLAAADSLRAGDMTREGLETVVAVKEIEGETFRAVFEVRPGKNNRALALLTMTIKN